MFTRELRKGSRHRRDRRPHMVFSAGGGQKSSSTHTLQGHWRIKELKLETQFFPPSSSSRLFSLPFPLSPIPSCPPAPFCPLLPSRLFRFPFPPLPLPLPFSSPFRTAMAGALGEVLLLSRVREGALAANVFLTMLTPEYTSGDNRCNYFCWWCFVRGEVPPTDRMGTMAGLSPGSSTVQGEGVKMRGGERAIHHSGLQSVRSD